MPFFIPQEQPRPLPTLGTAIERAVMDWKVVADATTFHKAKDVAAFANHLGGTILIGAKETAGQLERYVGLEPAAAGLARDSFSKAVADRCLPRPEIDFDEYADPTDDTRRVVAVNVWPSLLLIGVRIDAHRETEGYGGSSFVYPIRFGTDARYLDPTQVAMYMTPQVRRVAVLLSKIPLRTEITIDIPSKHHSFTGVLVEVAEQDNIVKFDSTDGNPLMRVPLDRITTVFEDWNADRRRPYWHMYVNYAG